MPLFKLGNGDRRPDIFDVFEHENRILGRVLELMEEQKGLFTIAQTPFYALA